MSLLKLIVLGLWLVYVVVFSWFKEFILKVFYNLNILVLLLLVELIVCIIVLN